MAVAIIQDFGPAEPGDTEIYDRLNARLEGAGFEGLLFHWAGLVDGHWRVTDVWESEEHYSRWIEQSLMPALHEVTQGSPGDPPRVTQAEVHNFIRP